MNDISATLLTEIRIPFMGSVENARIQLWSAKEGARLTPDDVLCEIETDKTVMEINAPDHGILARRTVVAGTDLKVGDLIGYLAPPDAAPNRSPGRWPRSMAPPSRPPPRQPMQPMQPTRRNRRGFGSRPTRAAWRRITSSTWRA
jgi:pyruvate/2-oxoglutarate dehydrogenase complex dihydrolipoamide acyltransferase (E2) component